MQIKCPKCDFQAPNLNGLSLHASWKHELGGQSLYDILFPNSKRMCGCGCNVQTSFKSVCAGYAKFLKGHHLRKHRKPEEIDAVPFCECGCNQHVEWNEHFGKFNSYVHGHNAKGKPNFFKGLTKETSEKFARQSKTILENLEERTKRSDRLKLSHQMKKIPRGKFHHNWKGGTTQLGEFLRGHQRLYKLWRLPILSRDNFRCILCDADNSHKLNVHHNDIEMSEIVKLFCVNVDELSQDEKVDVTNKIIDYHIENNISGITVCAVCHHKIHKVKNTTQNEMFNSIEQFVEIISNKYEIDRKKQLIKIDEKLIINYHDLLNSSISKEQLQTTIDGIRLFHIFEDEWRDKQEIIKGMIRSRLGIIAYKFDARKLNIVKLQDTKSDKARRRKFFDTTHIDGDTHALFTYSLQDDLGADVAMLSIRRPMHRKHRDAHLLEVARFSTTLDTCVRGGLGKLMAAARRDMPNMKFMTYVDLRLGDGHGYEAVGFIDDESSPAAVRFWWTDFEHRYNRFSCRADRSRNMTEAQVADEKGLTKIFGCENRRMTL